MIGEVVSEWGPHFTRDPLVTNWRKTPSPLKSKRCRAYKMSRNLKVCHDYNPGGHSHVKVVSMRGNGL